MRTRERERLVKNLERALHLRQEILALDNKLYRMVDEVKEDHPEHYLYETTLHKLDVLEEKLREIRESMAKYGVTFKWP